MPIWMTTVWSLVSSNTAYLKFSYLTLEKKDQISIALGGLALLISFSSFAIALASFRQRSREGATAIRKQLSDSVQKLLDLNTEMAKRDAEPDKYPANYGNLIGDQRRFHARVAHDLVQRLRYRVSRWEIGLIARAFVDLTDYRTADGLFRRSMRLHTSGVEGATVARGFAAFLFRSGEQEAGRQKLQQALRFLQKEENVPFEKGYCYEYWAGLEWNFGEKDRVGALCEKAIVHYNSDPWTQRRERSINKLKATDYYAGSTDENLKTANKIMLEGE